MSGRAATARLAAAALAAVLLFGCGGGRRERRGVTVISPNGGEAWSAGQSREITWNAAWVAGDVEIHYSLDGGGTYPNLIASVPVGAGVYAWTVPDEESTQCRVRVREAGGGIGDESDADFTITRAKIRVISPNGAESWDLGSTQTVTWTSELVTEVRIELYRCGAWEELAASLPDTGSFSWTFPGPPASDCLIRVSDAADGVPADESDSAFLLRGVEVLSPNGGETWHYEGDDRDILWSAAGVAGNVDILYTADGGLTWGAVATVPAAGGSYTWIMPDEDSPNCRVRVQEAGGGVGDESDADFAIAPATVTVTSPNGGETWAIGCTYPITWTVVGVAGNVDVSYTANGGTSWSPVATVPASDGSCSWTVPNEESAQCRVRVQDADGAPADESDAEFTIGPAAITVISPNGGETWYYLGDDREIAWMAPGVAGNVEILYTADGGVTWDLIVTVPADDGSYAWTVPNEESTQCRVRVQEEGGSGLSDDSDADFIITATPLPHSGVSLMGLGRASLAWGDYDSDGDLDIAIAGQTAGGSSATKLYRNDGSGSFAEVDAGLAGAYYSGFAWGDYDSDGDLDIAVAGYNTVGGKGYDARVYRNDGGGTFVDISAPLVGVWIGAVAWGDYDSDGDLDLALVGRCSAPDGCIGKIYRNDGSDLFTDILAPIADVATHHGLTWGDYDNDGDLDLALAGQDVYFNRLTRIYRNESGSLTDVAAGLPGVYYCALAWGDYDSDGDLDLVLSGHTQDERVSDVYRNEGGGTFSPVGAGLRAVDDCSVAWGDHDNDGDLDLALAGIWWNDDENRIEYENTVYRNDGGAFTDMGVGLTGLRRCSVAWGDYDNDGDLDLAGAGLDLDLVPVSDIYTNEGSVFNTPPSAPGGLSATAAAGDVTFSWSAATDAETPANGLSYNLRVGTTPGGEDVLAGMADLSTGYRRIPATGDASALCWVLRDLPSGTYYWSVQAIDAAFAGSPWSAEAAADVQPWVRVVYPNGGELCGAGSTQAVAWLSSGLTNVRVELSRDDGASWEDIVASTDAAAGSYDWTVTGPESDLCLVRVSDALDGAPADVSDATFSIPAVKVTSPNGGELWGIGSARAVTWEAVGTVANVRVELYRNGSWEDLGASVPNTGSYSWDPVTAPHAKDCLVRVSDALDGDPSDESDAAFIIPLFCDAEAALAGVRYCSLAWGDIDADGDLDLALAGYGSGGYESEIYANDGSGGFASIGAGLTGVDDCSLAWGDCDSDGDLDLAVAGMDASYDDVTKIYRNDGGTFVDWGAALAGARYCSLAWGDYDNDGDLDLVLAGSGGGTRRSRLYRNEGATFLEVDAGLPGARSCSLAWGDYDNDGDLDLALAGSTADGLVSRIYRNDGCGAFADAGVSLQEVSACSIAWGDYDSDGDLDLALAGYSGGDPARTSKVYRNDGGGAFTDIAAGLPEIDDCSLAWGDSDNDGNLDLALAGYLSATVYISRVYRNDGGGTFSDIEVELQGVRYCSLAWGDVDGDGDLDLALAGRTTGGASVSKVYRNDGGTFNAPPGAPAGLSAAVSGNEVTFSWSAAADAETPQAGLSYNLRVGTTPGGGNVFSGMADSTSGLRRIPATGNSQKRLSWTLRYLGGTCYWSVQAVDAAFAGSAWAPEETVAVPPSITVTSPNGGEAWYYQGIDRSITWRAPGVAGNVEIHYSTDGGASYPDHVATVPASDESCTWSIPDENSSQCRVRVREEGGGGLSDESDADFEIASLPFSDTGAALAGADECSLAWGDYDNDGDLDLAVAGADDAGAPASKIYGNDGAGTLVDINAGLAGLEECALAWGDYDSDGDLDLAAAGYGGGAGRVYRNDGGDTFVDTDAQLAAVRQCSLAWGDYDNDGDLDLALAGYLGGWDPISKVYRNDGGTFTDIYAGLIGVGWCSLAWGDYDNDGDLDLAMAGDANVSPWRVGRIYRNDGGGAFADIGAGLSGVEYCSLAWGDYDSDGDLDLALAGYGAYRESKVYRNDGGTFVDIGARLKELDFCSLAWGDYDNDGDLDLALAGRYEDSDYKGFAEVYENDGAGGFSAVEAELAGVRNCSVAWGDADGDGDLDLAVAGRDDGGLPSSKVYSNDGGAFNTPPSAPAGLSAAFAGNEVTFSWNAATDAETPRLGLSYNLRVGTTPGGNEVFSGMAESSTGWRRIPATGNAQGRLSWTLNGLAPGSYYWSVQAIDAAFASSLWAPQETATVP